MYRYILYESCSQFDLLLLILYSLQKASPQVRINRHGDISITAGPGHATPLRDSPTRDSAGDAAGEGSGVAEEKEADASPASPRRPVFFGSLTRDALHEASASLEMSQLRKTIRAVLRRLRHTASNADTSWRWIDLEKRNAASGIQFSRGLRKLGVECGSKEAQLLFEFLGNGAMRMCFYLPLHFK